MTALAPVEPADTPAALMRRIPTMDGHRATEVVVQFSGAGLLDHLSPADLELIEAAKLGGEVLLLVRGTVAAKSFRLVGSPTDGLRFACSVKVSSVEDAERA